MFQGTANDPDIRFAGVASIVVRFLKLGSFRNYERVSEVRCFRVR